jgi:hypothetical protein
MTGAVNSERPAKAARVGESDRRRQSRWRSGSWQSSRAAAAGLTTAAGRTRKRGATGRQRDPDERFLGKRSCRCAAPWLPGRDRAGPGLVEP